MKVARPGELLPHSEATLHSQASWLLQHEVILVAQASLRLGWASQGSEKSVKMTLLPSLLSIFCIFF